MSKLTIIQVNTKDIGGGTEGSAWNLFQAYRERGHRSWLIVGKKYSNDKNVVEIPHVKYFNVWTKFFHMLFQGQKKFKRTNNFIYTGLRIVTYGWPEIASCMGHEKYFYPGTKEILKLIPDKPDIMHMHNLHGNYFDLRVLASLSQQIPIILNLRDMWLLTGHCAQPINCSRWKEGCGQCPDLDIYPKIRRDATAFNWKRKNNVYKNSKLYITAVSNWLMQQVDHSILRNFPSRMISNGIDLELFKPFDKLKARKILGLPSDSLIVLMTAHNEFKNFHIMECALKRIDIDQEKILYICLGRGEESKFIGKGLMIFPGFEKNHSRMALYYCASDVFLHAAKAEAFGKTIAEAMSCGTPVVATAIGGIPELIEDNKTGYLVSEEKEMAEKIKELLLNPGIRKKIGDAAAAEAKKKFSLKDQVDSFLHWYEEILQYKIH